MVNAYCSLCGEQFDLFKDLFGHLLLTRTFPPEEDEGYYFCEQCYNMLKTNYVTHDWKTGRRYPK